MQSKGNPRRVQSRPRTAANAGNLLLVMIVVIIFLVIYVRMPRYRELSARAFRGGSGRTGCWRIIFGGGFSAAAASRVVAVAFPVAVADSGGGGASGGW